MLFKRKDGHKVKVDPFMRFIPLIMKDRNDALVYLSEEIDLRPLDEYIRNKYETTGNRISYMHLIYAAMIRTLREKPKINQFIMNGNFYMRNNIVISMAVKKEMSLDGEETSLKFEFTGLETPEQIKTLMNEKINAEKNIDTSGNNATDKFIGALMKTPTTVLKFIVGSLKLFDKWNIMPKFVIEASPFHASSFITNLGSIGLDAAFHHIANFGTVGSFISIGKKSKKIVKQGSEFVEVKTMRVSFVVDERICDGFYWASALKTFFKYLNQPEKLEESLESEIA